MNVVGALVWKNRHKKQGRVASFPRMWESRTRWVCGDDENTAGTAMLRCLNSRVGILFALSFLLLGAGCTPSLHDVIGRGDMEHAKSMLIAHPALAHSVNVLGKQPMQYAVFYKQDQALEMLLEAGADVNAADDTGMTALHTAAWMGRRETLWLLAHGADLTQCDVFGDRPSHTAAIHDQIGVLRALFKAGDPLTARNHAGLTPLELARKYRNPRAVARIKKLIDRHDPDKE